MDSKHGGSPVSGIVPPAGLDTAKPVAPGSMILEPEVAKENRNAKDRALQFERRRLALAIIEGLSSPIQFLPGFTAEQEQEWLRAEARNAEITTRTALIRADELLKQTGGHV